MTPNDPQTSHLELALGADVVALRQLVSASSTFAGLLREVTREYVGDERAIEWIVEVKPGSVRLPVRAEPATDQATPAIVAEMPTVIAGGVQKIDSQSIRPAYFSNRALEQVKALANLGSDEFPIAILNGRIAAPLTKRVMTHVDEILGPPRAGFGTVEGRLEAINIHGKPRFAVFDALSGARAECYFATDRVSLEDIGRAIGQRVAVRGRLRTKASGDRSIEVLQFRRFDPEDALPGPRDIVGILAPEA